MLRRRSPPELGVKIVWDIDRSSNAHDIIMSLLMQAIAALKATWRPADYLVGSAQKMDENLNLPPCRFLCGLQTPCGQAVCSGYRPGEARLLGLPDKVCEA
jgi:hypothetical protein